MRKNVECRFVNNMVLSHEVNNIKKNWHNFKNS